MAELDKTRFYDVVVVGGGPAGLTAALYLARAKQRVLVMEKDHLGGQITITSEVENFPGVMKCSGEELARTMRTQADNFGAEFLQTEVTSLEPQENYHVVHTARGDFSCHGILLATGAAPRLGGFIGEDEYRGRGIGYCATCDGSFFIDKDVYVIGGGYAAAEESVFLTRFARHVTILIRGNDFSCAAQVADMARKHPKITVLTNIEVESVTGTADGRGINAVHAVKKPTGEKVTFTAPSDENLGLFVFAGYAPATSLLAGKATLDASGYVITDENMATSAPGIYAAGDLRVKKLRQVVTAVSDGAIAASALEHYCAARREVTGLAGTQAATGNNGSVTKAGLSSDTGSSISSGAGSTGATNPPEAAGSLFDAGMLAQLQTVFNRMEKSLVLEVHSDGSPLSLELKSYMQSLADLTTRLSVVEINEAGKDATKETVNEAAKEAIKENGVSSAGNAEKKVSSSLPFVRIVSDGEYTGLAFHGVPGGHEFTSFVLGLYNAAGKGQEVEASLRGRIEAISKPLDLKVLVSLSCTMCPELVTSAQRLATLSSHVTTEVFDITHFPELKERYRVMSVPCLVINDEHIAFGRKNLAQLLDLLQQKNAVH